MKSGWKVLSGLVALVLVGLGFVWSIPDRPIVSGAGARVAGGAPAGLGDRNTLPFTVTVSGVGRNAYAARLINV